MRSPVTAVRLKEKKAAETPNTGQDSDGGWAGIIRRSSSALRKNVDNGGQHISAAVATTTAAVVIIIFVVTLKEITEENCNGHERSERSQPNLKKYKITINPCLVFVCCITHIIGFILIYESHLDWKRFENCSRLLVVAWISWRCRCRMRNENGQRRCVPRSRVVD